MPPFQPFIRISWEEALQELQAALHKKYSASGSLVLMKDYGSYEGVKSFYDEPDFVDIFLRGEQP